MNIIYHKNRGKNMNKPIGIFDSGVGGLTVLDTLRKKLPNENLIYIGDNKNCPYGDKTKEQLLEYTYEICDYFASLDVKMIILACNTTSANCLAELQVRYPSIPIVGVISSTVHYLLSSENKRVLVIATNATIQSHKYKELIHQYDKEVDVYELATPKLVPLIESGVYKHGIHDVLKEYLESYKDKIDAIILGCTHYPIVKNQIKEVLGDEMNYISSSESLRDEVASYIALHNLENKDTNRYIKIYTTGDKEEFLNASKDFFEYGHLCVDELII